MSMPRRRNHFLALAFIVDRTSALIIALSMLLIVSNRQSPSTVIMISIMSMFVEF